MLDNGKYYFYNISNDRDDIFSVCDDTSPKIYFKKLEILYENEAMCSVNLIQLFEIFVSRDRLHKKYEK